VKIIVTSNTAKMAQRYRNMARNMPGIVNQALHDLVAQEAIPQFKATTATWTHKPAFTPQPTERGWMVAVNPAQPYTWVDAGTKPHIIKAKNVPLLRFAGPYHAKTKPNVIAAYKGGRGNVWVSKRMVHHPGTEARNFRDIIMRRMQARAANKVRAALNEASYGAGFGL
jgi:hypothetical protein